MCQLYLWFKEHSNILLFLFFFFLFLSFFFLFYFFHLFLLLCSFYSWVIKIRNKLSLKFTSTKSPRKKIQFNILKLTKNEHVQSINTVLHFNILCVHVLLLPPSFPLFSKWQSKKAGGYWMVKNSWKILCCHTVLSTGRCERGFLLFRHC